MDSNCYVLLWNLKCDSAQVIAPGIGVRPLTAKLTVFDLAAAGAVGFREWATLEVMVSACVAELESSKDASITPGYDTLNRAWLACSMMVLRGCGKVLPVAVSAYSWDKIAGFQAGGSEVFRKQLREEGAKAAVYSPRHQLPPFTGGLLDYRLRLLLCRSVSNDRLTKEDGEWMLCHFEQFNTLAHQSDKFRLALESSCDWRYATDARSAIARLWVGIEALLGINSELVYRLSITAASLLRPRGEQRIQYAARLKKLYSVRSKAVHGDALSEAVINDALEDSFVLLRDLLVLVVNRKADVDESTMLSAVLG